MNLIEVNEALKISFVTTMKKKNVSLGILISLRYEKTRKYQILQIFSSSPRNLITYHKHKSHAKFTNYF